MSPFNQETVNVLLLSANEKGPSHLTQYLQRLGCHCWYAKSAEEALALFEKHKFSLVLSASPLRLASAMVARLGESNCSVFYCHPVEDGCWWLPLMDHGKQCMGVPALRPGEFVSALGRILGKNGATAA